MNYRLYSADMTKSLARVANEASVKRDAGVLQGQYRQGEDAGRPAQGPAALRYAMKAYGLEDQIQSKG